jgi:hypothetical protein
VKESIDLTNAIVIGHLYPQDTKEKGTTGNTEDIPQAARVRDHKNEMKPMKLTNFTKPKEKNAESSLKKGPPLNLRTSKMTTSPTN